MNNFFRALVPRYSFAVAVVRLLALVGAVGGIGLAIYRWGASENSPFLVVIGVAIAALMCARVIPWAASAFSPWSATIAMGAVMGWMAGFCRIGGQMDLLLVGGVFCLLVYGISSFALLNYGYLNRREMKWLIARMKRFNEVEQWLARNVPNGQIPRWIDLKASASITRKHAHARIDARQRARKLRLAADLEAARTTTPEPQ